MSGSLRLAGGNRIALTVALDGAPAIVLEGPLADLDKLEQQAAERVFAAVDPINDVLYLEVSGRTDDAMAQAARAPQQVAAPIYRAVAYSLWAFETRRLTGNLALARQRIALAIATDPKVAPAHIEIVREASVLGHDEEELQAARSLAHFRRQDQPLSMRGRGFDEIEYEAGSARDTETGDFQAAAGLVCGDLHPAAMALCALYAARSRDAARGRVLLVRAQAGGESDEAAIALARYYVDADIGAWLAAVADARQYLSVEKTQPRQSAKLSDLEARTRTLPLLAVATAETGDMAGAKALIAKAPPDCDACVRARGRIAAIAHDWTAAAHWFAVVSARSPDIPFADSDWGQMLLRKGDFDGAIAKFASANRKGAHFADPLEYWGEALIAKNRSDLALAKFAEANKYAPNWGRLHLKWGEALLWIGDKAGAAKQFAVAAHLDLTPSEKSELARVSHG
ncbi:MAG: hypothetical protein JSR81_16040 [Proteobacteria bacterium]|nr:hypothetical protein [Pseudomonadota bacterium]